MKNIFAESHTEHRWWCSYTDQTIITKYRKLLNYNFNKKKIWDLQFASTQFQDSRKTLISRPNLSTQWALQAFSLDSKHASHTEWGRWMQKHCSTRRRRGTAYREGRKQLERRARGAPVRQARATIAVAAACRTQHKTHWQWEWGIFWIAVERFRPLRFFRLCGHTIWGRREDGWFGIQVGGQKHNKDVQFFSHSYFVNCQIWLNRLMDDRHRGSITKKTHWFGCNGLYLTLFG